MISGVGLKILLWALAIFLGAFAAMTGREYFVAPILRIIDKCKEMRWPAILFNVAFCTMLISAAIEAGATKTNGVMNLPPQMMTMQHPALVQFQSPVFAQPQMLTSGAPLEQTVSDEEIAQGYSCVLETNEVAYSYAMPSNAQIVGNWHTRGTFGEWMPVSLGWTFPLGTNSYSSVSVFNDGMIRPKPRDVDHQITAVGAPMLFTQGLSMFWTLDCDDGSKLLTWDNAFLNGDTNTPLNAQIRLRQNGNFSTRSNEMLRVYSRVNPADWDGDGLANVIDVMPKASNGDCFGTGVDWLNANCGGVLSASVDTNGEIVISWNDAVNPDAYYWLTFTSLADNSLISITCDGPSNLGDLTVIANSNQVCQVPVLVGASYHVTAEGPLSEVSVSDQNAVIDYNDAQPPSPPTRGGMRAAGQQAATSDFYVDYELNVSFTPNGGGFWALGAAPKNPGMSLDDISGCCCSSFVTTNGFTWTCSDSCTCGSAGHLLTATVSWEGYSKVYWYETLCGCAYDAPPPEPQEGSYAASVSVSFDKGAIIFEDAYENLPGVWVGRRSTSAHLTIHANGGPNGGVLTVSSQNLDKLQKNSGPAFPTVPVAVPAGYSITYGMNYVGVGASSNINDIVVNGSFTENGGSNVFATACMTAIQIELEPEEIPIDNNCVNRHLVGVDEKVWLRNYPSSANLEIVDEVDVDVYLDGGGFWCPWSGGRYYPTVRAGTCEFQTCIDVLEPVVSCRNVEWSGDIGTNGVAGNIMMRLDLYIEPTTVSFAGLAMEEVPTDIGLGHGGYFDDQTKGGLWSHTQAAGAGHWDVVQTNAYWTTDHPQVISYAQPWCDGWKEWKIPVGWGIFGTVKGVIDPDPTTQRFEITEGGDVTIFKYNHSIKRAIDNKVWVDGSRVY